MNFQFLNVLMLSTVFLMPLLGAVGNFGYEQIKVLFFILSITVIGFVWMGRGIKWTLVGKAAGVFILILLVTSLTGIDLKSSLLGKDPYFQGWILYAYLFLFYLMVKTLKIELKKYALVLAISSLLVSLLAIKDWILLNILSIWVGEAE